MLPTRQGSLRLFRFAGIDVFLHWSWFIVALFEINTRGREYSSLLWNGFEYLALFSIVLLHEFGHALACRQTGGKADQIVLWPLGGVAYVSPPPRPGATLWSIAAGPLVNLLLAPALTVLYFLASRAELGDTMPNAFAFLRAVLILNFGLLIFNLLPIYPLDGGQILRSLLWFPFGRARSLMITAIIGFAGVALLLGLALLTRSVWIGIIAAFILLSCWGGLKHARLLARAEQLPRHAGFACPECKQPPVAGAFWKCGGCQAVFDTFQTRAVCPVCGGEFPATACFECGASHPMSRWAAAAPPEPGSAA
jgi:Zn-dependent protease